MKPAVRADLLSYLADLAAHQGRYLLAHAAAHPDPNDRRTLRAKFELARTMNLVRRLQPPPWRAAEVTS